MVQPDNPDTALDEAKLTELVRMRVLALPRMARGGPPPSMPLAPLRDILEELAKSRADRC